MFFGFFPPWAGVLIGVGIVAGVAFVIFVGVAIYRQVEFENLKRSGALRFYVIASVLMVIAAISIATASVKAYNSQVALYNQATSAQSLVHVDAIDGVYGSMHVYNTAGNCWVYAKYDPYQKSVILDASQLRNGSISLNGTTVYSLTTKPLSQEGIDQLCEANYGEEAFNNNDE